LKHPVRDELANAKLLLEKGEYKRALKVVNASALRKKVKVDENLAGIRALLESRLRLKLGEPKKALTLLDKFLRKARQQQNIMMIVDFLTVKSNVFWYLGKLDEGLEVIEEAWKLLSKTSVKDAENWDEQVKQRRGALLHHSGIIHWYKGELDQALENHQRSLSIKKELGDRSGVADSLNNLGLVYLSKGELDNALDYYQRSLKIKEELGDKDGFATILNNLGNIHQSKGELDHALNCYQRSLKIKEEIGKKQDITTALINLGATYRLKGDLDRALDYYHRSLTMCEKTGNKHEIALTLNNLGDVYDLKGELDRALDYYQKSLALNKELDHKLGIALLLENIGSILMKKGSADEAQQHYQQSLAIYEEVGNEPFAAMVLFELIWLALNGNNPSLAQQYLQRLERINDRNDNQKIDQHYRVAKALWLKTRRSTRYKVAAEEILEKVIEEEVSTHSLTVTAMIQLCDLLLAELKVTGEGEVLARVKSLTQRLFNIAKQQSSHTLLVETYLLKSKFALIELDIGEAKKLLVKAHNLAKEKGLHNLAETVAKERDLLLDQLHKWETVVEQKPSKPEMIELTKLNDLLERMIRTTVAKISEEEKGVNEKKDPEKLSYKKVILPNRVSTGHRDLDQLLLGGIPKNYAVVLTAPPCNERDEIIKSFLETGPRKGQLTVYVTRRMTGISQLLQGAPSNFHAFIFNPQAERLVKPFSNVTKFKGVADINNFNIELKKFCDKLDDVAKEPRRICLEIISDILLQLKTVQTRRWLSDLVPQLTMKGFTILAMMNPRMHRTEDYQAILEIFDGEISILEKTTTKGSKKILKIQKMYNQKHLEEEILL
jgi:tetratricopeptide (TPR) repeat protein/KaiC/GvpD/RAD55 family RecA-like ATPase